MSESTPKVERGVQAEKDQKKKMGINNPRSTSPHPEML